MTCPRANFTFAFMIINGRKCKHGITSKTATAKAAFKRKETVFISKLDLNLRQKVLKSYI
jgi:hypothetical protein